MTIDRSGTFWTGSERADIAEYLRALTADSYPADRVIHATCACGNARFRLSVDADEGCAQRTCTSCKQKHLICDSAESWADASAKPVKCPCGGKEFDVAVAFSHRDDGSLRWITVGERCTACGVLGAAVDWKIDYEPTHHLYEAV
jgi:hypothetical protein